MDLDVVMKDIQTFLAIRQKLEIYFRFNRSEDIDYEHGIILDTEEGSVLRLPCWPDEANEYSYRDIPLSLLALPLEGMLLQLQEEQRIRQQKWREEQQARKEKAKQKAAAKKARQALQKEEEERLKLKELLQKYGSPE